MMIFQAWNMTQCYVHGKIRCVCKCVFVCCMWLYVVVCEFGNIAIPPFRHYVFLLYS